MDNPLLTIDDPASVRESIMRDLQQSGLGYIERPDPTRDPKSDTAATSAPFDVILSDLNMSDMGDLDFADAVTDPIQTSE